VVIPTVWQPRDANVKVVYGRIQQNRDVRAVGNWLPGVAVVASFQLAFVLSRDALDLRWS
jgi:hypothetical protein